MWDYSSYHFEAFLFTFNFSVVHVSRNAASLLISTDVMLTHESSLWSDSFLLLSPLAPVSTPPALFSLPPLCTFSCFSWLNQVFKLIHLYYSLTFSVIYPLWFMHIYSVLLSLTFHPFSRTYLHLSGLCSTCFLLSLQITMLWLQLSLLSDSCLTCHPIDHCYTQTSPWYNQYFVLYKIVLSMCLYVPKVFL